MRILVMEDIQSGADKSCTLLRKFGHEIVARLLLSENIVALDSYAADAVLVDISNENSNSLDSFSRLHRSNKNHCIVILSIHDERDLALDFIKSGAQDYLIKGRIGRHSLARCMEFGVERHTAALKQRVREEHMKLVLEDSHDAFISMNSDLIITDWNSLAERTFGWKKEEILGKSISFITPPHLRKQFLRNIQNYFEEHPGNFIKTSGEIQAQHRSGIRFPAELGVYRLEQESECTFYGYLRDITRENQTKEELEKLVEQRTQELTRSNNELEQFAKIASHDLQEPLRAIEGFSSLLVKRASGQLDKDCIDFLDFIVDGVKRMQTLTQSILIHSQISEKTNLDQTSSGNAVLQAVLDDMQGILDETGASLEVEFLPDVAVEKSQMVQLFQNLLSNSIKYRGTSPPIISIRAKRTMSQWVFSFRDNGIGIEPQYAENIFDMFSRLHTKQEYPGTGMGLAICKRIVNSHGGRIWVESALGKGSNFMFTLPSSKEKRNAKMKDTVQILLIEDTPSDVRLTEEALKETSLNYTLTTRKDGVEGMKYLNELKNSNSESLPDIILLDLNMPRMNGHQVLESIKKDIILRSIPVILLTVSEREEDVLEALSTKMNYYLAKPISSEKISVLIKSIYEINALDDSPNGEHTREETHIRLVLAGNPHTSDFALSKLANAEEESVRCRVASNKRITPELQTRLSRDPVPDVRICLCENPKLLTSILEMLASDQSVDVRLAVSRIPTISARILSKLADDENVYVSESARKALSYRA
ncbi:MAG: response regulator [Candidatus Obscuribacterales bacterium]